MYISILTPTYNRAYTLERLYSSLDGQTSKDFEWIIVDDGSTDNTCELVKSFIQEASFPISYIYKENEGKHIAINSGISKANGKFTFFVDSDDYLVPKAIECVINYCRKIENDTTYAGVATLRGYDQSSVIIGLNKSMNIRKFISQYGKVINASSADYRYKYKITGDRAEVVRTQLIKEHPFIKFDNEKYLSEDYFWNQLNKEHLKFRWVSRITYITEYNPDGLTNNIRKLAMENWKGHIACANYVLNSDFVPIREKIRLCIRYYRYGIFGNETIANLFDQCNNKLLSIICMLR